MTLEITKENFEETVLNSNTPVMVDFYAEWCGPCSTLTPIIESLAEDNKDKPFKIGKLNVDNNTEIAAKFGIRGIPCVLVFKDGKIIDGGRLVGLLKKEEYQNLIDTL